MALMGTYCVLPLPCRVVNAQSVALPRFSKFSESLPSCVVCCSGERVLRAGVVQCKSEVVGRKWGGVRWERVGMGERGRGRGMVIVYH